MKMKLWGIGVVVVMLAYTVGEGWGEDRSCVNQLLPCLNYLNGTRDPPQTCCDPLKSVIKSNPECLCSMITNKATNEAEASGINVAEAQQLPGRCGQHVNPIACLTTSTGGAPNSKNSVPNGARDSFRCPTMILMAATSSLVTVQLLWMLNDMLT